MRTNCKVTAHEKVTESKHDYRFRFTHSSTTAMAGSSSDQAMPDLPGYYYDSTRKRYFKGARPQSGTLQPPSPKRPANAMNLARLLRHVHENGCASSRTLITARVLSTSKHASTVDLSMLQMHEDGDFEEEDGRAIEFHAISTAPRNLDDADPPSIHEVLSALIAVPRNPRLSAITTPAVLNSCIAVNGMGNDRVRIHKFPSGSVVAGTFYDGTPITSVWNAKKSLLVYAVHWGGDHELVWFPLPSKSAMIQRFSARISDLVNVLDISDGGRVAVGCATARVQRRRNYEGVVYVYNETSTQMLSHRISSPVLDVKFVDEDTLVIGTRSGKLQVLDCKTKSSVTLRKAGKGEVRQSVCCMRVEGREVYVSSLGNVAENLVCYDIDAVVSGDNAQAPPPPCTRYLGHKNVAKKLVFDVGGSILASPGDDGVVRFWNKFKGGHPIDLRTYRNEQPRMVKFVGFEHEEQCRNGNQRNVRHLRGEMSENVNETNGSVEDNVHDDSSEQKEESGEKVESNSKELPTGSGFWTVTESRIYAYLS